MRVTQAISQVFESIGNRIEGSRQASRERRDADVQSVRNIIQQCTDYYRPETERTNLGHDYAGDKAALIMAKAMRGGFKKRLSEGGTVTWMERSSQNLPGRRGDAEFKASIRAKLDKAFQRGLRIEDNALKNHKSASEKAEAARSREVRQTVRSFVDGQMPGGEFKKRLSNELRDLWQGKWQEKTEDYDQDFADFVSERSAFDPENHGFVRNENRSRKEFIKYLSAEAMEHSDLWKAINDGDGRVLDEHFQDWAHQRWMDKVMPDAKVVAAKRREGVGASPQQADNRSAASVSPSGNEVNNVSSPPEAAQTGVGMTASGLKTMAEEAQNLINEKRRRENGTSPLTANSNAVSGAGSAALKELEKAENQACELAGQAVHKAKQAIADSSDKSIKEAKEAAEKAEAFVEQCIQLTSIKLDDPEFNRKISLRNAAISAFDKAQEEIGKAEHALLTVVGASPISSATGNSRLRAAEEARKQAHQAMENANELFRIAHKDGRDEYFAYAQGAVDEFRKHTERCFEFLESDRSQQAELLRQELQRYVEFVQGTVKIVTKPGSESPNPGGDHIPESNEPVAGPSGVISDGGPSVLAIGSPVPSVGVHDQPVEDGRDAVEDAETASPSMRQNGMHKQKRDVTMLSDSARLSASVGTKTEYFEQEVEKQKEQARKMILMKAVTPDVRRMVGY